MRAVVRARIVALELLVAPTRQCDCDRCEELVAAFGPRVDALRVGAEASA